MLTTMLTNPNLSESLGIGQHIHLRNYDNEDKKSFDFVQVELLDELCFSNFILQIFYFPLFRNGHLKVSDALSLEGDIL